MVYQHQERDRAKKKSPKMDQIKYVWYLSPKIAETVMKFQSPSRIFMQEHRYSLPTTNALLCTTVPDLNTIDNGRSNMMICLTE